MLGIGTGFFRSENGGGDAGQVVQQARLRPQQSSDYTNVLARFDAAKKPERINS